MARPKEFNIDVALDAAVGVFREHGFAGSSAQMLIEAMKIGKQSLYDTFGGKWQLYCAAVARYSSAETAEHIAMLQSETTAMAGIEQMLERVVAEAHRPCLGLSAISEFATSRDDLVGIREQAGRALRVALQQKLVEAQQTGAVSAELDPDQGTAFLLANIAAIRLAARAGAKPSELNALKALTLKALR
ncbi:TetR family transcriptional regulator [Paramixta manurensis]|uniref:TetR family transcriptional regulator n=1 Tax=Paramixta manurensis TaxID=2740817 RepID=A0A6M8U9B6_9GAMM|nr:TetR family transcriptional regulator [Erwiniaceae bacterium PD-1]